jgi:hypothetical protein
MERVTASNTLANTDHRPLTRGAQNRPRSDTRQVLQRRAFPDLMSDPQHHGNSQWISFLTYLVSEQ